MGPPGVGKGTQAKYLAEKRDLNIISIGNLLRNEVSKCSEIGLKIKNILEETGNLVPDSIIIELVQKHLQTLLAKEKGIVIDGFPRTLEQAKAFDDLLIKLETKIIRVINLFVDKEILVKRLEGRFLCSKCQTAYNTYYNRPFIDGQCDKCNGKEFYKRKDDSPEIIMERFVVFNEQTQPVIDYYRSKNMLTDVNGDAKYSEDITEEIEYALDSAYEYPENDIRFMEQRRIYAEKAMEKLGFDNTQDAAAMIVRYISAMKDTYSLDRYDPFLCPLIRKTKKRYDEGRMYDFSVASQIAMTEAIREIIKHFQK